VTKWIDANEDQASLDREKSGIKWQQMTFSGEALKFFGQLLIYSIKVSGPLLPLFPLSPCLLGEGWFIK